jgi:hypothetical protein
MMAPADIFSSPSIFGQTNLAQSCLHFERNNAEGDRVNVQKLCAP